MPDAARPGAMSVLGPDVRRPIISVSKAIDGTGYVLAGHGALGGEAFCLLKRLSR